MPKSDREIMEILEAFDLTQCPDAAGRLACCDAKTVKHHVIRRDAGLVAVASMRRDRIIDPFVEKIEELVERSRGDIRADVVHHQHLVPMGFVGDERTTRRAVAEAKAAWFAGRCRTYQPWVPEPGMWLQFDWGQAVRRLLHQMGFSVQVPSKQVEGASHPDRDGQFRHINDLVAERLAAGEPVVSVDTKKKELIGNYANGGREWQPAGEPERANVHDFADRASESSPRPSPMASMTWATTKAGSASATRAEFAVESIRTPATTEGVCWARRTGDRAARR